MSFSRQLEIFLPVSLLPGDSVLEVPLHSDTTAEDVIEDCINLGKLGENQENGFWVLVADLQGFEKRFWPQERLYQLVRKQVLLAGNTEGVRFYLRKKKKRHSVCSIQSLQEENLYSPILPDTKRTKSKPADGYSSDVEVSRGKRKKKYKPSIHMMPVAEQQPLRVAQPPTPTFNPTAQQAANPVPSPMSYGELVQLAERQRRQVDSNKTAIQQKEARLRMLKQNQRTAQAHAAAASRLKSLREELGQDESEVARLRALQEKVLHEHSINQGTKTELERLQELFSNKEKELRSAVGKVDTLRCQLDQLQLRRQSAANAANAMAVREQRLAGQKSELANKQAELRGIDNRIEELIGHLRQPPEDRPKAAVEPFKVTPSASSPAIQSQKSTTAPDKSRKQEMHDFVSSKGYAMVMSAVKQALVEHEQDPQLVTTQHNVDITDGKVNNEKISPPLSRPTLPLLTSRPTPPNVTSTKLQSNREEQSSPSSSSLSSEERNSPNGTKVTLSINRRLQKMLNESESVLDAEAPPPDLIPQSEKSMFGATSQETGRERTDSDTIHIRNNNLRAAKRRSWAHEPTNDETDHIRQVLLREQQKGRSNINFRFIFDQSTPELPPPAIPPVPEEKEIVIKPPPPYNAHQPPPYAPPPYQLPPPYKPDKSDTSSTNSDDTEKVTVIDVDPDFSLPPAPKGILKGASVSSRRPEGKRNIRFDPLAILLDAALEGELDLVKQSTRQILNVSMCNDEGITALHNAICAGHYEIVRFLVEADADVNAQDSDGWTPLHCAASCNNLPMVKFLVERGACVFATTLSDHETPADKCEEEEDGFDGCSQFLLNIQDKIGRMCDGRVYGAYSFDAGQEDELTFGQSDQLTILRRDGEEKGWWWCRHETNTKEGYVPRNYLALYPRLSAQRTMQPSPELAKEGLEIPKEMRDDANNNEKLEIEE